MKRFLFLALLALVTGCATTGQPQTPAQIAAEVCPSLKTGLSSMQALQGLSDDKQAQLNSAAPMIQAVCVDEAQVNTISLQSVVDTAVPILLDVIKLSSLTVDRQNDLILGISAAKIIIQTGLAINQKASTPAVAPSAPVSQ